jgi:hypothetical protein
MKSLYSPHFASLCTAVTLVAAAGSAWADDGSEITVASRREEGPPAGAKEEKVKDEAGDAKAESGERPDKARFRGGFVFEGGGVIIPDSILTGGAASAVVPTLHLGVQINHLFGVYYQNRPLLALMVGAEGDSGGVAVGFSDHNVAMASFTLFHTLELAAGAGFDFYALAGCASDGDAAGCGAGTVVTPGVEGKVAAHLGGWSGDDPGRAGFTISAALHTSIDPASGGVIMMPLGGLGAEWF